MQSVIHSGGRQFKALTFDVFGTVVDYRRSITALGRGITSRTGIDVDWGQFADRWRGEYRPGMDAAMTSSDNWVHVDEIYREALKRLAPEFGLDALPPGEHESLANIWSNLTPWGDSVPGLHRLRSKYIVGTLSNGNVRMLTDMAKAAGLPWDVILTAELFGAYKPDPRPYLTALEVLRLEADEMLFVAAHADELRAVQTLGIGTAFILRPVEFGPGVDVDTEGIETFDYVANDLTDLAEQLGV
ncbi:haloacid dehalogenase, type II [Rhodococcus sp. 06-621-2]|nr:haloacid dehalogenase type II [Rhodococcus sp. 06-621-2]OZC55531.1 haloacid dehalogenase, type II [Rhodococcus sp. 06-621-2]